MTEPPQFPRYADGPQDGEPGRHPQQYAANPPPKGPPYAGSTQPHGQPYGEGPAPYGYPAEYGHGYPQVQNTEPNSLALAALISSLMGIGPLAVGLGVAALRAIPRTGERGTWMAWTGIVIGGLESLLFLLWLVAIVILAS